MKPFLTLIAGVLLLTGQPAPASPTPPAAASTGERSVTLVTGDRVRVSADVRRVETVPGPGRKHVRFGVRRVGEHLYVIPADVLSQVGRRRLDPRLFDVAGLLAAGYDDARTDKLPLIVRYAGKPTIQGARPLTAVNGAAMAVPKSELASLLAPRSGVEKIWLDGKRKLLLDHSAGQIGAPVAWSAGYTGRGVTVAVLDGGVDSTHPDLAGRVESRNFTTAEPGDADGHGTHVASIVGGAGGRYRGIAPEATILDGKVCARECNESWILAGMEWAAVERGARIVNLSLGGPDGLGLDVLEEAVDTLTERTGALFVVAAGNWGPFEQTISSPASADAALAVGAVDREDRLTDFSARGPRIGDSGLKPDLVAPGQSIAAARATGIDIGEPVDEHYTRLTGTSMAAPHVAGAAALLAQRHPTWRAKELRGALQSTARSLPGMTVFEQGSGRVDVATATESPVVADTGALSYGVQAWPHTDDVAVSRNIVYRNQSRQDVVLDLSASFTGPDGRPAPAGALTVSAPTVTVPAEGSAAVAVTSNSRHDGPDGTYGGRLVATGPGVALNTTLHVVKEVESYDLTVRHLDRSGAPTGVHLDWVFGLDRTSFHELASADGTTRFRLPKGRYLLDTLIASASGDELSMLLRPELELDRDHSITMDDRRTEPFDITVPEPGARSSMFEVGFDLDTARISDRLVGDSAAGLRTAQFGSVPDGLESHVHGQWARPDPEGGDLFEDSPYIYGVAYRRAGLYTGFSKHLRHSDLAVLDGTLTRHRGGGTGVLAIAPDIGAAIARGFGYGYRQELPLTTRLYVNGGIRWSSEAILVGTDDAMWMTSPFTSYQPGCRYRIWWGRATLGPTFRQNGEPSVYREGNVIVPMPPMADGDGNGGISMNGTVKLSRNGTELRTLMYPLPQKDSERIPVPAEDGEYRVALSTNGNPATELSSRIDTSWTFRSKAADGDGPLPLWAIRFHPAVDDRNVLHSGPTHQLPIEVRPQADSPVGRLDSLVLDVSTDDGATWQRARVSPVDGRYVATVPVSGNSAYVSLKAKATDSRGNTVDQTIIRAYAVTR